VAPGSGDCSISATLGAEGHAFTITSGEDEVGNDFGNYQQGTKSGTKFSDENNNHVWDFGEPPLSGWTIKVFNDLDNSNTLSAGDTLESSMATLGDGSYSFILDPGEYVVCEVAQATWTQTYPTGNTICDFDAIDATLADAGYAITITSGEDEVSNDFGNFFPPQEGCTPGFWQGGFGIQLWNQSNDFQWTFYGGADTNPFTTTTVFSAFFNASGNTFVDNATMLTIVGSGGTNNPARKAARNLIAAYLNASWGLDYPATIAEILADWDDARTVGNAYDFMAFHLEYSAYNQLGCPIP